MSDCQDCFSCKMCRSKGYIRCDQDEWKYEGGQQKIVKLTTNEKRNGDINYRKIFKQGEDCPLNTERER